MISRCSRAAFNTHRSAPAERTSSGSMAERGHTGTSMASHMTTQEKLRHEHAHTQTHILLSLNGVFLCPKTFFFNFFMSYELLNSLKSSCFHWTQQRTNDKRPSSSSFYELHTQTAAVSTAALRVRLHFIYHSIGSSGNNRSRFVFSLSLLQSN